MRPTPLERAILSPSGRSRFAGADRRWEPLAYPHGLGALLCGMLKGG